MKYKTVLAMIVFPVFFSTLVCFGEDYSGKNALFIDLSQSALSWETGGMGLTLSYERILGSRVSFLGKGIYMDLADAPGEPKLILASLGCRCYFAPPALKGFFAGFYPMAGIAREGNETTFLAGATTELGFSWRVGKARRLILEPHIQYPYFISQPPLIGIVPGISLGYLF